MQPRKRRDVGLKIAFALEAFKGGKTLKEIAADHGIHPVQVSAWKRMLRGNLAKIFSGGAPRPDRTRGIGPLPEEPMQASRHHPIIPVLSEKIGAAGKPGAHGEDSGVRGAVSGFRRAPDNEGVEAGGPRGESQARAPADAEAGPMYGFSAIPSDVPPVHHAHRVARFH